MQIVLLAVAEDNQLLELLFPGVDRRQEPVAPGLFEGYGEFNNAGRSATDLIT
jgi:hypothetical protein